MNQDFALPATPGIARRLVEIAKLCKLDLAPEIAEQARTDLIGDEVFDPLACPATPMRRAAVQFMLDCELRCVMMGALHGEIDRHVVITALRAAGQAKVTVAATGAVGTWKALLRSYGVEGDAVVSTVRTLFEAEQQQDRRDGVLIIEWNGDFSENMAIALCREFERTVVYVPVSNASVITSNQRRFMGMDMRMNTRGDGDGSPPMDQPIFWWEMGTALCPDMPRLWFDFSVSEFARHVTPKNSWQVSDRDSIALFYNVFLPGKLGNYGACSPA